MGKKVSTEYESGLFHAKGHEITGIPIARNFICRLTADKSLIHYVLNMVECHMRPNVCARDNSSVNATCKMFRRSVSPSDLILLSYCDCVSSHAIGESGVYDPEKVRKTAENNMDFLKKRLKIYEERIKAPGVTGKDLIEAGYVPGKDFNESLEFCENLKLCGVPREQILKSVLSEFPQKNNII